MFNWLTAALLRRGNIANGIRPASVLVPVTGGPSDRDVVRLACELLEPVGSRLYVLYVIEVDRDTPVDAEIVRDAQTGESVLDEMEGVARQYNCLVEAQLVQARQVGAAVVREAVDKSVSAIVLGTSVTDRFGQYSLEAHIPYVLRHAPCRVVLSRDPIQTPLGPADQTFGLRTD